MKFIHRKGVFARASRPDLLRDIVVMEKASDLSDLRMGPENTARHDERLMLSIRQIYRGLPAKGILTRHR